jgi:predicted permease
VVSALAGILFGLAPARHAARTDANAALKGGEGSTQGKRIALRDILVVVQVALCFVLVSACLLSLRGLQRSLDMHLGFEPKGVAVAAFDLSLAGYNQQRGKDFQRHVVDTLAQLPGVQSVAYGNSVPLSIDQSHSSIYSEDQANATTPIGNTVAYEVSPNYFGTLGISMLAGRDFNWHDDPAAPRVAVINLAFAKQILRTPNALGKRFHHGPGGYLYEVVGIVETGKYENPTEPEKPAFFQCITQQYNSTTTMVVRSSLPEEQMVAKLKEQIASLDPELPLSGTGPLRQILGFAFLPLHAAVIALSAFGLLAAVLAITGIYGLVSYGVARRVREIGIRVAIGANPRQVIQLVLARTFMLLSIGAAIGLLLALASRPLLQSIVFGSAQDPILLAEVCLTMLVLGLISSWFPTRRALKIEPTVALRHE